MIKVALPTQAEIKQILHYDTETGVFRWRQAMGKGRIKPWSIAAPNNFNRYVRVGINKKRHQAHRLAWLYMTGEWPQNDIDHIDGIKSNNAWKNLREATTKQNCENKKLNKNNKSGFRGVFWSLRDKKWIAQIGHNKKMIYSGVFDTAEEAGNAAAAKRAELFTHDMGRDKVAR